MTVPHTWLLGGRELRRTAKGVWPWVRRTGLVVVALVVLSTILLLMDVQAGFHSAVGLVLFRLSFAWAALAALLAGPGLAADLISAERRDGTLDLLRLAGIRPAAVVIGKFYAVALEVVPALLALVPVLMLPVLVGGVSGSQVGLALAALLLIGLWSISVGLACSAWCRDGRIASGLAIVGLLGWSLGTHFGAAPGTFWNDLSPVGLLLDVSDPAGAAAGASQPDFGRWAGVSLAFGLWMGAAAVFAEWIQSVTLARLIVGVSHRLRRWSSLGQPRPKGWGREWMEEEPLAWLVLRDRASGRFLFAVTGCVLCGWLVGLNLWNSFWSGSPVGIVGVCFTLMAMVKVWLALDTTRRLAEDRDSGALQLLLSTGLPPDELLRGVERGLFRRFLPPVLLVVAMTVSGALFIPMAGRGDGHLVLLLVLALVVFVFDAFALTWTGLHDGLVQGNATRAFTATVFKGLLLPWLLLGPFVAVFATAFASGMGMPHRFLFLVGTCWFLTSFLMDGFLVARSGPALAERLHHCAIGFEEPRVPFWRRWIRLR